MKKRERQQLQEVKAAVVIAQKEIADCRGKKHAPYRVIHGQDLCLRCLALSHASVETIRKILDREDEPALEAEVGNGRLKEVLLAVLGCALLIVFCILLAWFGRR